MYQRSKAAKRAGTPEPFNGDDWKRLALILRDAANKLQERAVAGVSEKAARSVRILAERAEEWAEHFEAEWRRRMPVPPPPRPSAEAEHQRMRKSIVQRLAVDGLTDLEEHGFWQLNGEDPNCDMCGPHSRPNLGVFQGTLSDAIDHAVDLPNFCTWGGGGFIARANVARKR